MKRTPEILFDEMLVMRSQKGDQKALAILVKRWHPRLVRFAYHFAGDKDVIQDIVQESWQAILKSLPSLKNPSGFRVWFLRIVRNKSVDWIRKRQRDRQVMEHPLAMENISQEHEEAITENQTTLVKVALKKLPEDRKIILTMYYLEELSVPEISLVLKISPGTVKSRLFYARKYLKEILESMNIL